MQGLKAVYGQNGSNFYRFQFNGIEFIGLFSNHKSQISDKPQWKRG